jgi:hypothetical protein
MKAVLIIGIAGLLLPVTVLAEAELLLQDGQVLTGVEVELKDGVYKLELEDGSFLSLPAALVKEVRLTGGDEDATPERDPTVLAGPPEPIREPTRTEQMAVFREPEAQFQKNLVNPYWRPHSDWVMDPANNEFAPTRWIEAPVDSTWIPVSAYTRETDVTEFNPAGWKSITDPYWYPVNGFR